VLQHLLTLFIDLIMLFTKQIDDCFTDCESSLQKDALSMTTGCLSDIRAIRPSVHFTARLFYDFKR
jgi:hypothetical protein